MSVFRELSDITVHFSKVVGLTVVNEAGQKVGVLKDVFVDYEDVYPLVIALQLTKNKQSFYVLWKDVIHFNYRRIVVRNDAHFGRSRTYPKVCNTKVITSLLANQFSGETVEYPPIGKVVLDRQIVDTSGKKVVRVNDIEFIKTGQYLRVTHAAIGFRSMVRRLGFEKVVDSLVRVIRPGSKYLTGDVLINWKFVHAIPDKSIQASVKLSLTNEDIKGIHPSDLADILEDLDPNARDLIFSNLDPETAAATLSEVEQEYQASFIRNKDQAEVARILENMGTDEAADILSELEDEHADEIISKIEDGEIQEEIQELLEYDEDTAGGLMSTEVFEIASHYKKSDILAMIQDNYDDFESIYDIFVVDANGRLIGTCPLFKLLIQKEDVEIGQIMETEQLQFLSPSTGWKDVASYMSKYNLINVPIIDDNRNLLGIISVDDVLPWLLDER